ncbi:uncharacterized protein, partial [Leptinotarsa decemlineata]|uniref:uncharacterized protein n=1 Tax=Leptinotarsa decemlineata TaxID=7539 RepID=UPI003D30D39F
FSIFSERLNVLYEKNWTRLVTEQLKRFERAVVESGKSEDSIHSAGPRWTFGGALLYSVTLLTTVGYGKLSPKTALGKIVAMIYAIIGVPLMLILLSALGNLLASGARKGYSKMCCHSEDNMIKDTAVGYHKAPSSPSGKFYCKSHEDSASIQITSSNNTPNHVNCKLNHHPPYIDHQEVPKRAILATVRSTHTRGRCRQGPVRQTLADTSMSMCPTHSNHGTPMRNSLNSSIVGITSSDLEDADDTDENEHVVCTTHDTPSRIPLIWRPPEPNMRTSTPILAVPSPSVPAFLVVTIFFSYVCLGAFAFSSSSGWSFLDSIYFCFIAISTIGVGDRLPQSPEYHNQIQLFACCVYLFLGLVVVAMCFSLVQEEVTVRCRQIANNVGLVKD